MGDDRRGGMGSHGGCDNYTVTVSVTVTIVMGDKWGDSVATRMQSLQPEPRARYRSVFGALREMVLSEGLGRPFRGIHVTALGAGPAHALYFACYEHIKRQLSEVSCTGRRNQPPANWY
uniref:Mitoferrin-1 n=1 Tax=Malurus cyaneus samueli TaxID=2593467 RepID=A0A8C5TZ12_9PASS